jgi:hypothetical protein
MHDECTKKSTVYHSVSSNIQSLYNSTKLEARKCSGIYYQKPILSVHVNRKAGMQRTDGIKLQLNSMGHASQENLQEFARNILARGIA